MNKIYNFHLNIDLIEHERSLDSHSNIYKVDITNRDVKFNWKCAFRGPKETDHSYKLSEEGFENLLAYIKENNLNRNLKEIRKAENLGLSINLTVKIEMENIKTEAQIVGMYKDWKNRGKKKECNIKNIDYYNTISLIISQAENKNDSFPIRSLF